MKTLSNGTAVALLAVVITGLASGISRAEVKTETWQFNSAATPISADSSTNAPAGCQAVVAPGDFADGWIPSNPLLGNAAGIWDLGRNGTITCNNLATLLGGSSGERTFSVKVKQWRDGGIYIVPADVSATGAVVEKTISTFTPSGSGLGGWLTQETQWRASAGSSVNAVQITSAYDGSLVDQVSIEASTSVVQLPAPELTIQRIGDQLQISWPADYATMQLQSTTDVQDAQGWSPLDATVQVNGNIASVTINCDGPARFYRLKQP